MNILEKIFCFMGGADLKILKICPTDKIKFIVTGIGVLNTALLSMCFMGYAMYSIEKELNIYLIIFFAIFWGFIIFGIDWGLISTIHKKKSYDLKSGSALVGTALFRLLVAVIISFTVSKPLEVLVFNDYLPVAKRDMQVDFQNKLDALHKNTENTAENNLSNVENAIININDEKQRAYQNDPIVKQLTEEKNSLQSQYDNLNDQYKKMNAKSSEKASSAQSSINTIQNNIDQIKNSTSELSGYQRQQISNYESSKQPYIATRNFENEEIRKRNTELSTLNSKINTKHNNITTRYREIDTDFNNKKTDLNTLKERFVIEKDSISKIAKDEYAKNETASQVFKKDKLINNIISIGYLEKWNNDPNATVGEKEIAKKVSFVSWLLMILIMIVDTAPIVIKLLVKRGCYEEEKEKIEKDNRTKCLADSIAYEQTYPAYALMKEQYKIKIEELTDLKKATIDFYTLVNTLTENVMEKIRKNLANYNGRFSNFKNEMENLLDATLKKMIELYNKFISGIR